MKSSNTMLYIRLVFLLIISGFNCMAQTTLPKITLFDRSEVIAIPLYPRMAVATGQSGTIKASIRVDSSGQYVIESVSDGPRFLVEGVKKSLKSLSFLAGNIHGYIEISFEFILLPNTADESEIISEIFPELNKIVIKSRRPTLLTITDPPALP